MNQSPETYSTSSPYPVYALTLILIVILFRNKAKKKKEEEMVFSCARVCASIVYALSKKYCGGHGCHNIPIFAITMEF